MLEPKFSSIPASELNALTPMSELAQDVLAVVETHYTIKRKLLTVDEIAERLDIDYDSAKQVYSEPAFKQALRTKGLVTDSRFKNSLTPQQVHCANIVTNRHDAKTFREKLQICGVKVNQWNAWMADAVFSKYVQEKGNLDFNSSDHIFQGSLLEGVQNGDAASLKLYAEIRGIFQNKVSVDVNINLVVEQLVEVALMFIPEEKWEEFASGIERVRGLATSGSNQIIDVMPRTLALSI